MICFSLQDYRLAYSPLPFPFFSPAKYAKLYSWQTHAPRRVISKVYSSDSIHINPVIFNVSPTSSHITQGPKTTNRIQPAFNPPHIPSHYPTLYVNPPSPPHSQFDPLQLNKNSLTTGAPLNSGFNSIQFKKYCSPPLLFSKNPVLNLLTKLFGGNSGTAASNPGNVMINFFLKSSNSLYRFLIFILGPSSVSTEIFQTVKAPMLVEEVLIVM